MIPALRRLNTRTGRNAAVKLGRELAGRAATLALLSLILLVPLRPGVETAGGGP